MVNKVYDFRIPLVIGTVVDKFKDTNINDANKKNTRSIFNHYIAYQDINLDHTNVNRDKYHIEPTVFV